MRLRLLRLLVPLLLSGAAAHGQEAHDYRIVNGITIDLQPVHSWFAKDKRDRQGERPIKHWKQLQITELKEQIGSWTKCLVKTEENSNIELMILNLPAEVKTFFQSMSQQYQAIVKWRAAIESDKRKIRQLDAVIPVAAGGDPAYVNTVMAQRSQLETWKANLETVKEELAKGEALYNQALSEASDKLTVFAMFSGRKYLNLEIWDCGQKRL